MKKGDRVTTKAQIPFAGRKILPGHLGTVHDPQWCKRYLVIRWDGVKELYMTMQAKEIAYIVPATGK